MTIEASSLKNIYESHSQHEYHQLLEEIVEKAKDVIAKATSSRFQIKYRVKKFDSYLNKVIALEKAGQDPVAIEDMLGIRIVCPFLNDLDEIERVMSEHFTVHEVDRKYQGQSFREFGYDSTHLVLDINEAMKQTVTHPLPYISFVCEVQLRTILQDAWAEVEHELIYKSAWPIPTFQIQRKLAALNANLTLSDIIFQELRDFQRDIVQKQTKRRTLAKDVSGLLSNSAISTELSEKSTPSRSHDALEKLIIQALNAHADELFEEAIELYTHALQIPEVEPVRSILLNHRGMAYLALDFFDKAHIDFEASTESDPGNYRAWYNLGITLSSQQRLSSALKAHETCLRLNPSFNDARIKQVELMMEMGEREKATQVVTALEQNNVDKEIVHLLKQKISH